MNRYFEEWLNLIYQRDQFYFYVLVIVVVGFLWYGWLRLRRYFRIVLAGLLVLVMIGIVWGLYQLPMSK